jgi:hypothetical protein
MVCIYIHRGFNDYLNDIFALTRHYNNHTRLILIGDDLNKDIALKYNIEHYPIKDYNEDIPYHHVSVNTVTYEKFCFERWFILKNFVNRHNITKCVYSDSDNAVLYDLTTSNYSNAYLGHSTVIVPNLFFCTADVLNQICKYYLELYSLTYDECYSRIVNSKYITTYNNNLQFSDMMFLSMAVNELALPFEHLNEKPGETYCYNSNINDVNVTLSKDKVIVNGTTTYLRNIHFAGAAKRLTKSYLSLIRR